MAAFAPHEFLESEAALDCFLTGFENSALTAFPHAAHIAVGALFCLAYEPDEALVRVRDRIMRLNIALGGANTEDAGYHETLTVFWLNTLRGFLTARCTGLDRLDAVRLAVAEFEGQRDFFKRFYSFDVVKSKEARRVWVGPNL